MKGPLLAGVGLIVVAGAALMIMRSEPPPPSSTSANSANDGRTLPPVRANAQSDPPPLNSNVPSTQSPASSPSAPEGVTQTGDKVFQVDSSGKLVLSEQTRLNIEALFALSEAEHLPAAKDDAVGALPRGAAQQAADLLDRYDNYSQAQRQAYPPGIAPSTEEEALAQLDGLHALRIAHFGADVAQAFYGAEETLSRQLIELMRLEKDQGLTLEEKAVRAQQLRDSMP